MNVFLPNGILTMNKVIFVLCLLSLWGNLLWAQEVQDSVKIRIETSPGAEIGIDDDMSSTNVLTKKINVGRHIVRIRYGINFVKEYELFVENGAESFYKYPIDGTLSISTTPNEAHVYVDGIEVGQTPLDLSLLGNHTIRIEKDPDTYFDVSETVRIMPFEKVSGNYILTRRPPKLYGLVLANYSPMYNGLGGFLGLCRRWGAFIHFSTTIESAMGQLDDRFADSEYVIGSEGTGLYKKSNPKSTFFAGGLMFRPHKSWYTYIGGGYGEYAQKYELTGDANPSYAEMEIFPYGSRGFVADIGVIYKYKALLLSCGYNTIIGKSNPANTLNHNIYVGIGISIHNNRRK